MIGTLSALRAQLPVRRNPYLDRLERGALTRVELLASQTQFFFAVRHYRHPLTALADRFAAGDRIESALRENIRDELGGDDPNLGHEQTFLELLSRLGQGREQTLAARPNTAVLEFNRALDRLCGSGVPAEALACLCAIEDRFAVCSRRIGAALVQYYGVPSERMIHYDLHGALDIVHAEKLFEAMREGDEVVLQRGFGTGDALLQELYLGL